MNAEIQRGLVQSAMPPAPNGPLQGKVDDQFCSHAPAGAFLAERDHPNQELEAGGQLVLQATSSAKSPKTMNTEIQRGLVQSGAPLTPNGPLQGEVDDHF